MAAQHQQRQHADEAFQASHWKALASLWRQRLLCDVQLRASSGELLAAHSIVLASGSGFFRALLCGAGRSMREGCLAASNSSQPQQQQHGPNAAPAGSISGATSQQLVVDLPYSAHQLSVLLEVLYEHRLEVCAHSVSWLLDMAAFLEVQPLQEACCEFLRSAMCPDACVDVLLLAHHYHCSQLQAEAVAYLATRLSGLLLMPDTRQALLRLPEPLLQQLLSSEAVDVEQELELLCFVANWVCHSPSERQHCLPQLLPLLKLSALPEEQLSQQQLQACGGPSAAALAQELYRAAQACCRAQAPPSPAQHRHQQEQQQQRPAWQQQQQQQPPQQQQHLMASRRQAGQAVADPSIAGRCLARMGRSADVNNNGSSISLDSDGIPGSPMVCSSSGGCGGNNSADALPSSSSGSEGGAARAGLPDVCEQLSSIGAVVAQAWPGRQRGYQPTSLLVAGGHDPSWRGLKTVELYDPADNAWRPGPMLPMALPFAGAGVATRGQVYVIGGAMCSNFMARLDVADEAWQTCEGPALSRLHAGVCGSAGHLYVTGGRTQVNVVVSAVEAYDHTSASWHSLPDMMQPRYAHAAVAQGGCLYALGGQASKAIHRTVEVYDPQRGSWQALAAQLANERKYCAAASLGGRLLVLGGMNEARRRLSTVEAYDPREGRWTELTSMQHARSSCSVACVGGRLYVMGGSAGNEQLHSSVEVLDPLTGQWSTCAALSSGRSGLTAVAV